MQSLCSSSAFNRDRGVSQVAPHSAGARKRVTPILPNTVRVLTSTVNLSAGLQDIVIASPQGCLPCWPPST